MPSEELLNRISDAANDISSTLSASVRITLAIDPERTRFAVRFAKLIKNLVDQRDYVAWQIVANEMIEETAVRLVNLAENLRGVTLPLDAARGMELYEEIGNLMPHMPWVTLLSMPLEMSEDSITKIQELQSKMETVYSKAETSFSEKESEWDQALKSAQNKAGTAGAEGFIHEFNDEANKQKRLAWAWLAVAIVSGISLIGFSLALIFECFPSPESPDSTSSDSPDSASPDSPGNSFTWGAIYNVGGRLSILFVLFYATTWAGRMALVCFNLASINRHRAISLRNLEPFLEASGNEQVREAIVAEAAQTVFEHVPAGFLGKAEPTRTQPILSRVVELIRSRKGSE